VSEWWCFGHVTINYDIRTSIPVPYDGGGGSLT